MKYCRFIPLYLLSFFILVSSCSESSTKNEETKTTRNSKGKQELSIKTIPFGRFKKAFNDLNDKHIAAAKKNGIEPIKSQEEAEKTGSKLCEIKECKYYSLDELTHSIPYLVPKARKLLNTIGENFIDSIESRGGSGYKIIVTSVLRAEKDIRKLRKRNGNASQNSAHRYGTTVDIAYNRFARTNEKYEIPVEQLKHILGEVLLELKKSEKCYVKYEVKQGCFHITVR